MLTSKRIAAITVVTMLLAAGGAMDVHAATIKDFAGRYVGMAITQIDQLDPRNKIGHRDLDVVIKANSDGGFTLSWSTVFRYRWSSSKADTKTRTTMMTFLPMGKSNLWRSAGSGNLFDGKPTAWALLSGKSLYVHVVAMTNEGSLVTASYKRTLTGNGMSVVFRGTRDGDRIRVITGRLERQK